MIDQQVFIEHLSHIPDSVQDPGDACEQSPYSPVGGAHIPEGRYGQSI